MDIRERLNALPKTAILQMFCTLRGADTCGFNHELVKKTECVERLLSTFGVERVAALLDWEAPVKVEVPAAVEVPAPVEARAQAAAPVAAPAAPMPEAAALEALRQLLTPQVDEKRVRAIVDEIVGQRLPRAVEIRQQGRDAVRLDERTHPLFEKVTRLAAAGVNVLLVGPAGCGKTHLAHQVAKALGRTFASISGSAGVSEAHLTGRLLPTGDGGRFVYTPSPFVRQYTEGGVFLFDEMDAFDPNCLLIVNQATANGGFEIESRAAGGLNTFVPRHAESVLIGSANTFGTGAGALYVGRAQLDAATLDRWYPVMMDYDREWESTLAPAHVCAFVWKLRDGIQQHKLRRVASTRMIQKSASAVAAGVKWDAVQKDLTSGWTSEELSKCGVR